VEMTGLSRAQLERLLDPMALTQGGIQGAGPSGTVSSGPATSSGPAGSSSP
jgi:hypothetical protein